MKKFVAVMMVFVGVLSVMCLTGLSQNKAEAGVTDILPENSQVLIKFGAFEALQKNAAMTDTSVLGFSDHRY